MIIFKKWGGWKFQSNLCGCTHYPPHIRYRLYISPLSNSTANNHVQWLFERVLDINTTAAGSGWCHPHCFQNHDGKMDAWNILYNQLLCPCMVLIESFIVSSFLCRRFWENDFVLGPGHKNLFQSRNIKVSTDSSLLFLFAKKGTHSKKSYFTYKFNYDSNCALAMNIAWK
jgi:hypothetical protein